MSNLWLLPDDYEPMEEEAEPGMMGKLRFEVRTPGRGPEHLTSVGSKITFKASSMS